MSRIYWDTMLFVYWFEDTPGYSEQVEAIYSAMRTRGDTLCSSTFTIAELLVGPRKTGQIDLERNILKFFESSQIKIIPFDFAAAQQFASIRSAGRVSPANAIHLSCAAVDGVDLFLTNDLSLRKLVIPGIQFIDSMNTTVLNS